MSDIVIRVENLSKLYHIGALQQRHDTLRDALMSRFRRSPQSTNSEPASSDELWALRDVSFEVKRGDVVGIIGRNGAGKSTLLKILSRITEPTSGRVGLHGRVGSLLEVGTGFHPELTGRENIYLNGAILGMHRAEIDRQFDEIVAFAEIERFLDTPVKRYSSGMYVRLAFAVAAHLEPEILLVDEVLAVGDAEFQKKCLGKMRTIASEGRTIVFVSHNMTAISNLCRTTVVLRAGMVTYQGVTQIAIRKHLSESSGESQKRPLQDRITELPADSVFQLLDLLVSQSHSIEDQFVSSNSILIEIRYRVLQHITGLRIGFDLRNLDTGDIIFRTFHDDSEQQLCNTMPGNYISRAVLPANFLAPARYEVDVLVGIHAIRWILFDQVHYGFDVIHLDGVNAQYADKRPGLIMPKINWQTYS
ncbi:MAG: polysaccharide ABC transporter ATP-binding protein [Nitrosomonas ureae]